MTFLPEIMEKIYSIQKGMQQKFRDVPQEGKIVDYLGKEFIVYPEVFWPSEDSKALVKNYVVNPGERVLDVCTGSGVIACFSAWKGASKVVALDISPNAIRSCIENTKRHSLDNIIEARLSDVFGALESVEKFDVVTMNSPFTEHKSTDYAERTIWDQDLYVHNRFFSGLGSVLNENGRAYISHAGFGAIEKMHELANKAGFDVKEIGKNVVDDLRTFYAFELKRNI